MSFLSVITLPTPKGENIQWQCRYDDWFVWMENGVLCWQNNDDDGKPCTLYDQWKVNDWRSHISICENVPVAVSTKASSVDGNTLNDTECNKKASRHRAHFFFHVGGKVCACLSVKVSFCVLIRTWTVQFYWKAVTKSGPQPVVDTMTTEQTFRNNKTLTTNHRTDRHHKA